MAKLPMNPVNKVLNKVLANLGLDKRLREHTFMTLWPTFVSAAIAERSRPLFIDADCNLVVSVADAATGQELSMIKGKVLAKVTSTARSLNIDLRGLRLDMKHFHGASTMPIIEEEKPLPKPSQDELQAVQLTPADQAAADELKERLSAEGSVAAPLKERMVGLYERELRIRRFRLLNGFPVCPGCGNPCERLHSPNNAARKQRLEQKVCLTCLWQDGG